MCIVDRAGDPPVEPLLVVARDGDTASVRPFFGCGSLTLALDETPPVIDCPDEIVINVDRSETSGPAVEWELEFTDECEVVRAECSPPSGSVFPVGRTAVRCEVEDSSGNVSRCSFDVLIIQLAGSFRRGDANGDGSVDITDAVKSLNFLFSGGPASPCMDAADVNDDDRVDISDAIATLAYLFLGGARPATPGPSQCGGDPTPGNLPSCGFEKCP